MRRTLKTLVLLAVIAGLAGVARAQEVKPEIWEKRTDAEIKKVEEAARKDACLRLVEDVYRLPVERYRNVYDMMLKVDQVNQELIKELAKAPVVARKHLEDGRMQVTVVATPAQVVSILKKAYGKVDWALAEEDSTINAIARSTKADEQLLAKGEAALRKSPGEKHLLSRRAALLKAETDLAKQLLKMRIHDDQHLDDTVVKMVRDLPRMGDQIINGLSATVIHAEEFADDRSVEMTAEVKVGPVAVFIDNARRVYDTAGKYDRWVWNLARITEDMIFNAKASARPTEKTPKDEPLALEKRAFAEALKTMPKK